MAWKQAKSNFMHILISWIGKLKPGVTVLRILFFYSLFFFYCWYLSIHLLSNSMESSSKLNSSMPHNGSYRGLYLFWNSLSIFPMGHRIDFYLLTSFWQPSMPANTSHNILFSGLNPSQYSLAICINFKLILAKSLSYFSSPSNSKGDLRIPE